MKELSKFQVLGKTYTVEIDIRHDDNMVKYIFFCYDTEKKLAVAKLIIEHGHRWVLLFYGPNSPVNRIVTGDKAATVKARVLEHILTNFNNL